MKLEHVPASIRPLDKQAMEKSRKRWISIAKPLFSLGKLEKAITQIAGIRGDAKFPLEKKGLVIMCADNGVVEENVTQSGQDITAAVTENFAKYRTSVCFMARKAGAGLFPVDIGVSADVPGVTKPEWKLMYGTNNITKGPAMARETAVRAVELGIKKVGELKKNGYDILATGEMGIGNTTTSSAVASVMLGQPAERMTGRGAGLSSDGLERKVDAVKRAVAFNKPDKNDAIDVLAKVGGLDIAGMCGLFLGGAVYRLPIVIDGFISSVAALAAARICPKARDFMLPSHLSGEPAAALVLKALDMEPFITCGMSLGEGSGAVMLFPLLDMAYSVYMNMCTFDSWGHGTYRILK